VLRLIAKAQGQLVSIAGARGASSFAQRAGWDGLIALRAHQLALMGENMAWQHVAM